MKKACVDRPGRVWAAAGAAFSMWACADAGAGLVTANWLNAASGTWNVATNWSTNPAFPNNGAPPGETYHAIIDAVGAAYTVTLNSTVALDQLTLNSANATLSHTSGTLSVVNGIALNAGVFRLGSGTVANTTITSAGGALTTATGNSALNNLTLGADMTIVNNHQSVISNGLTLDQSVITVESGGGTPALRFNGTQTLEGIGEIVFGGTSTSGQVRSESAGQTLTIGENVTIRTGTGGGVVGLSTGSLVNQGTISAETANQNVFIRGTNWRNEGLLRATAGTLRLEGSIAVGGLGTIEANGGVIGLYGTLNNAGHTLLLDGSTARLTLGSGGAIVGGVVTGTNGGELRTGGAPTLDGVTLDANLRIFSGHTVESINGLTLANGATISLEQGGGPATLEFSGTQTLGGEGVVALNGTGLSNNIRSESAGQTLTIGENVTIRTGTGGGSIGLSTGSLVNQGTISVETANQNIFIRGTNWRNEGLLRATAGTLRLEGSIAVGGLGTIEANGGVVGLNGTLDNTGHTLVLDGVTQKLSLSSGTILGGTIKGINGGELLANTNTPFVESVLSGVTLDANLRILSWNEVQSVNGLTLANGATISLEHGGNAATLEFSGTQTLGGSGAVVFNGSGSSNTVRAELAGHTLTIGEDVTIRTGLRGGTVGLAAASLINQGTISAETASQTLTVTGTNWSNEGLLRASAGTLQMQGTGMINTGTIRAEGAGTARVAASGFVQQGVFEARAGGLARVQNSAALINEGTLLAGVNGRIEAANGLTQTGAGVVEVELGGLATNQFGRLTITGAAALDGVLALTPANGFAPDWGDAWTIMTFGSRTGDFAMLDAPSLADPNWTWWTEANATTYRVGVRHVADLNSDGAINFSDLNIVLGNYNMAGTALQGDITGDGLVNFADLNIVLGNFNLTAPTNVPAPGGAIALAMLGLAGARGRR